MTNIISLKDYQELWREHNPNTEQPDPSDASDTMNLCPPKFGNGYERWIQRCKSFFNHPQLSVSYKLIS